MSHPAGLPDLFLDRSLGRFKVPALLRVAGLRLTTLSEHYGVPVDAQIADEDWLQLAGSRGWVVLMKDKRIRYRRPELDAVKRHRVRCFCMAAGNLPAGETADRFLRCLPAIVEACRDAGPFVYMVYENRIRKVDLGC